MSKKILFALAGAAALLAAAPAWNADAAAPIGVSSLPSLVRGSSPVESARLVCGPRGCARVRSWRGSTAALGPRRHTAWGWRPRRQAWVGTTWGPRRHAWVGTTWGPRRHAWVSTPGWGSHCFWRGGVRVCRW